MISQHSTQFEKRRRPHCTEHSYTLSLSQCHEYDSMLKNLDTIISQLAAAKCSAPLADKLRSRKLISKAVYEEGVNSGPGVVESGRIRCMINAVLAKVEINTEHFSTFIEILKEIGGQEDLISLLQGMGSGIYLICMHCSNTIYAQGLSLQQYEFLLFDNSSSI